jgi:hypothetical protein
MNQEAIKTAGFLGIHPSARIPAPRAVAAAAAAAALLSAMAFTAGCVVAVRPAPVGVVYTEPGEVVVASEPPAPIVEVVGVAPAPGYIWIGGYYHWYGSHWGWVRGHYALPPRHGAVWVGPRYYAHGGHRVYVAGYWR